MKLKVAILGVFILALILFLSVIIVTSRQDRSEKPSPFTITRAKLNQMRSMVINYYIENKSWPDSNLWQEQIVTYLDKIDGWGVLQESRESLFLDGWGNKLKYVVKEHSGKTLRIVYSFGKNGQDEGGMGDDRIVEVELSPPSYEWSDPDTSIKKRLNNLSLAMRSYFLATGSWPTVEKWHQDIEKYLWDYYGEEFRYVQKYYGERVMFEGEYSIFRDPWGNEIQYVIDTSVEPPKRYLYSFGENRKDEKGAGDDIVSIINVADGHL